MGKNLLMILLTIGGDMSGLYHCILCGSSVLLRKLIYGKLTMDEAKGKALINYTKLDLNCTKFKTYTILPFTRESDISWLIDILAK